MVWTRSVGASALLPQRMRASVKAASELCRQHEKAPINDEEVQTPTLDSAQAWSEMRKRFRIAHNPAASRRQQPCNDVVFAPARRNAHDSGGAWL